MTYISDKVMRELSLLFDDFYDDNPLSSFLSSGDRQEEALRFIINAAVDAGVVKYVT